jgi:hypothetical protein
MHDTRYEIINTYSYTKVQLHGSNEKEKAILIALSVIQISNLLYPYSFNDGGNGCDVMSHYKLMLNINGGH